MSRRLLVVSNRLPALVPPGAAKGNFAVGGLVSGVRPALDARGGGLWVGWTGRTAARSGTHRLRDGGLETIGLDLHAEDVEEYYNGFCNGTLWPLLHSFTSRVAIGHAPYKRYRKVNDRFARAVAARARSGDAIWVHDFHLIPLAKELRARGVTAPIGFFLHVPFPGPDVFEILPWAEELLDDLAAYDLVGFHVPDYASNYEATVARLRGPRPPKVGVYPIGIDPAPYVEWASSAHGRRRGKELRQAVRGRKIVLGVDRLDYTKGIPERLRAFGKLLEKRKRWRQNVSFVQISAPSRTKVPEYVAQRREVEELVGNVNGRFGRTDWVPIRYLFQAYDQRELAAMYRESDVCFVSALRDGMNLVAKEFVAAQTGDPGVLVLSRFAGAAHELSDAVLVNPYDAEGTADALDRALSMHLDERERRQRGLLAAVKAQTAATWGDRFVADLVRAASRRGER